MTATLRNPPPEVVIELAKSRLYAESSGQAGERASFAFEELPDLDLLGAVLTGATLQSANLSGCRLDDATLFGALANGLRLERSQIARTIFTKADLAKAMFSHAIGPGAVFMKTRLYKARFDGAILPGANFSKASCIDASFRNAILDGADFWGAHLSGADFTGASLAHANLTRIALSSTTRLQMARGLEQVVVEEIMIDLKVFSGAAAREALFKIAGARA